MKKRNAYAALIEKHTKDYEDFPFFYAFSKERFEAGMRKFGFEPNELDKIGVIGSLNAYYRRSDEPRLVEMLVRHGKEMQDAIDGDSTGEGFIFDMFSYELWNHEFSVTNDVSDALKALGMTEDEVNASEKMRHGLKLAIKKERGRDWC